MGKKTIMTVVSLILIAWAGSAWASLPLSVDIGNSAFPAPGAVSWDGTTGGFGWDEHCGDSPPWEQHDDRTLSADHTLGTGIEFTINGFVGPAGMSGGKGGVWCSPEEDAGPLSRDFFYAHTKGDEIRLWIKNLAAGDYLLLSYHNDPGNVHPPIPSILVDDVEQLTDVPQMNTLSDEELVLNALETSLVAFTADGVNPVKITYRGLEPMLNGFTLIPEPATIALLGLGGLALLRRKR